MRIGNGSGLSLLPGVIGHRPMTAENLLLESEDFTSNPPWYVQAEIAVTGGHADPLGGSTAQSLTVETEGAGAYSQAYHADIVGLDVSDVVLSAYFKEIACPNRCELRLYNVTAGNLHLVQVAWSAGVGAIYGTPGTADHSGVVDIGSGWYRAWFHLDLATRGEDGDTFNVRIMPFNDDTVQGHGVLCWGVQLEPGTAPGPYLRKP